LDLTGKARFIPPFLLSHFIDERSEIATVLARA
jgi:hypothetical protein